jgi:threonine aldolase
MTGIKLLTVPTPDGKLTPELISHEAWGWGGEHRAQPLAVNFTQTTEMGTVYTPDEVRAIADFAHGHDMAVHLDGSRLWNGLLGAEAVVVLAPDRATGLVYLRKLTMQLASKMRFASASCSPCSTTALASAWRRMRTR